METMDRPKKDQRAKAEPQRPLSERGRMPVEEYHARLMALTPCQAACAACETLRQAGAMAATASNVAAIMNEIHAEVHARGANVRGHRGLDPEAIDNPDELDRLAACDPCEAGCTACADVKQVAALMLAWGSLFTLFDEVGREAASHYDRAKTHTGWRLPE